MLDALLALLVPPCCGACGAPARVGAALCGACRAALPWLPADLCPRCALPCPCGRRCPAAGAAFLRAWAPLALDGPARALVHALKFDGRPALAETMAAQIAANAPPGLLAGATLTAVPSHRRRSRGRGFDHARLLARALARRTGTARLELLERTGPATRQLGASRRQRRNAVAVAARRAVAGPVLLVDDVHTTGATLDACARALLSAGASEVRAVTYARTLR